MPNASTYIVDINKIRKPNNVGTSGIYVGTGSGNRESLFACRGTGSGSVVIYDKVLYYLSVDNISNIEPNAQTVTFTYSSKRTHGNLTDVDTLGINPTTSAITANHSTASTKTTTCTVKQSVTNNGTLTGNTVNVTVTQVKNYPTGLTLTISPKSTIPASGGSISSALTNFNYSVTAYYKSGSSSAVTSDSNTTITANVTGVTASSKGTTASNATTAGTITFTAKYVCNGKTVTTSTSVNIIQNLNKIESYNNPTFTLTPSSNQTLPASGGSVTASVSNVRQVRNWSSTSTDEISLTANASSNGYSVAWTNQTISCNSRGTTTGNTSTLGTTTANVTSTNGGSTTKSYTVYQEANAITAYSKPAGLTTSCADIPASGGTVTAATGGTVSQTRTYTSKSTDTIYPTPSITWSTGQTASANSLGTTTKARTKIVTLTATYTANGQSNTSSVDVYQAKNGVINTNYSPSNYEALISIGNGITAGSGSATVTASARHLAYDLYDSGSYNNQHYVSDGVTVAEVSDNNNRYSYSNGTLTHSSMTTNLATDSCTLRATNNTSTSATRDASVSVTNTRWHEGDTPSNYVATISIGSGINCTGGSATVSASASHKNTYTWAYTSGSKETGQIETITDTADTSLESGSSSRFSYSAPTLSHTTMRGAPGATDTATVRVRNHSNTATTNTASVSVSNSLSSTEWNNPSVTITPSSASVGSAATSTSFTASASQSGKNTYCAGDTASTSNTSFTYTWSSSDSTNFSVNTSGTVTISANPNDTTRSATITLKATGAGSKTGSTTATITQAAKESKLTPYIDHVYNGYYSIDGTDGSSVSKRFTTAGTSQTLVIQSDNSNPWTLTPRESWIYVSITSGTGDANVTISASTNSSSSDRTASPGITFKKSLTPNNNSTWDNKNITVFQSGTGSTPSTGTWSVINSSSSYGLYGTWTAINYSEQISGDWSANHTTTQNTPVPITLVSFAGAVTGPSYSGTPIIKNTNTSQSITLTRMDPSQQAYTWSGNFVVNNGDTLTITF